MYCVRHVARRRKRLWPVKMKRLTNVSSERRDVMLKKITLILAALFFTVTLAGCPQASAHPTDKEGANKWTKRSGLRFGYVYANNSDQPDADGEESKLESPHMFTMGFELQQCMPGGKWLDVLFIQNVSVTGLDQSVISPSARVLVGFEIDKSVQLAVGPQLTFYDPSGEDKYVHLTAAIGYTMDAGVFSVPVHFSFVPDVNDYWATAITTGVNW